MMTNKEYTLKYFFEHEDLLAQTIDCAVCRAVGLVEYCRATQGISCEDTKKEWLSMERNPLNLKVGDIVEISFLPTLTKLRYYMGSELNMMYFGETLEELKEVKRLGVVHYPNKGSLTMLDERTVDRLHVKKVGEANE